MFGFCFNTLLDRLVDILILACVVIVTPMVYRVVTMPALPTFEQWQAEKIQQADRYAKVCKEEGGKVAYNGKHLECLGGKHLKL